MTSLDPRLEDLYNPALSGAAPALIRSFTNKIKDIPGIILLTLGEPDFNTPQHVKEAGIQSISQNESHYSPAFGTLTFRQAVAGYLERTRGLVYNPNQEIIATTGATEALTAAALALLGPGVRVLIPTPAYPLYGSIAHLAGADVREVSTRPHDFKLTAQALEAEVLACHRQGKPLRAVFFNNPTNPTGVAYSKQEVEDLARVVTHYGLLVISDEVYSDLTYNQEYCSLASCAPSATIVVTSLSKSYAMTGWRIGFVAGPGKVMERIGKIHSLLVTSASNVAQAAAVEALNQGREDPPAFCSRFRERRDYFRKSLESCDFQVVNPSGAFYLFARIPLSYGTDDQTFALDLARKGLVGSVPGSCFGSDGRGYVRFSYAAGMEQLSQAAERIEQFVNQPV